MKAHFEYLEKEHKRIQVLKLLNELHLDCNYFIYFQLEISLGCINVIEEHFVFLKVCKEF